MKDLSFVYVLKLIIFVHTFVRTWPLNIKMLFITCNAPTCMFLLNNSIATLETTRGSCFNLLGPATVWRKFIVRGHTLSSCLQAVFHDNCFMFFVRKTQSLFWENCLNLWTYLLLMTWLGSFFSSSIWRRWLIDVLYCLNTSARHASLLWPLSTVFLVLPLNPSCFWNENKCIGLKSKHSVNIKEIQRITYKYCHT